MMKKLVVLTGAGISAESGIKTFRDGDGLWEEHNVMDVASPEGFARNPKLVFEFYNQRRKQLHEVQPNLGHQILAELEQDFDVSIITQNVDNLHEKAGSTKVLHLHGELFKARSTVDPTDIIDWTTDLNLGDLDARQNQMRPHIVWFGEEVPALEEAVFLTSQADIFVVVGTSLQVYPAAGLIDFTKPSTPMYYIDPKPAKIPNLSSKVEIISEIASIGMAILKKRIVEQFS